MGKQLIILTWPLWVLPATFYIAGKAMYEILKWDW